jgi:pimeloyl-ACP methyl ester carboxylesterase
MRVSLASAVVPDFVEFPGAVAPDRHRDVIAAGVRLAVHEWGDADAPVAFFVHGGFDFARTFDVFAPLIADRGWRVVSWDQRGHGDSEHTELYSWDADLRDALAVMASTTDEPAPVIGHSKGGALMIQLANAHPYRFSHLVNLDGIPFRRPMPDLADHERTRMLSADIAGWLDHRRATSSKQRRPDTIEGLASRRRRMNPRLGEDWLRYLVTVGARHDPDGWRWKIDPSMRMGGFGPWRPEWSLQRLPTLPMPFLGLLALEHEVMGWGTTPDEVRPFLPADGIVEGVEGLGHFLHIEAPELIAGRIIEFLEVTR